MLLFKQLTYLKVCVAIIYAYSPHYEIKEMFRFSRKMFFCKIVKSHSNLGMAFICCVCYFKGLCLKQSVRLAIFPNSQNHNLILRQDPLAP